MKNQNKALLVAKVSMKLDLFTNVV